MRLDRLVPEQEARLAAIREEWRGVGLATGPADRLRAERGMRAAYLAAGLPPPDLFLWVRSPLEGVLGTMHLAITGAGRDRLAAAVRAAYLDLVGRPGGEPWGRVWAPLGRRDDSLTVFLARAMVDTASVRHHVARRLPSQVGRAARADIGPRVAQQVHRELQGDVRWHVVRRLWSPVVAEIQTAAWQRLKAHVEEDHAGRWPWARAWAVVRDLYRLVGIQDALHAPAADRATPDWLAAYDFLGRVCGVEAVERLSGLMELSRAAGWWWWPQRGAVVLSERPERLQLDDQGRLHGARGPALAFPDGWSLWAWHGVRVPRAVIENPESLPAAEVLGEPDVEVRRVMIERVGHERLIRDGGARRVAEDEMGILWQLDLVEDEPLVCVEVTDATPGPDAAFKRYVLRVPPSVRTPREAVAWTFGVDTGECRPAIET
ncbi:MAG TPA: hypothetical protein VIC57_16340 [Candidatus Dormibacteraeota bacterium]